MKKKNSENSVGEPGQFKTTLVSGFTPTDHTPTALPEPGKSKRNISRKKPATTHDAEQEQLKRVAKHHREGDK